MVDCWSTQTLELKRVGANQVGCGGDEGVWVLWICVMSCSVQSVLMKVNSKKDAWPAVGGVLMVDCWKRV